MSPDDLVIGAWGARFRGRTFACAVGRGGIGDKQAEGDGVTPRGAHDLEMVLYRPDRIPRPRGGAPARAIGLGDVWSDDPMDPAYNSLARAPHGFGHEALRRSDPMYDLVAVLDWNRREIVRGRGSAIFLHVWRRPRYPTEGCIALARHDLFWVLDRWSADSRVIVF